MERNQLVLEFARASHAGNPFAFQFASQEYLLREEGGSFQAITIAWEQALLEDLASLQAPHRAPAVQQRIGENLRRWLEPAGWPEYERAILAARDSDTFLVLTIRAAAAELYALPWELLTLRATGQHLGELPHLLLRYEWPQHHSAAHSLTSPQTTAARILFAWSAAAAPVPASEQLELIAESCTQAAFPFDCEHDVLSNTTCARLAAKLAAAQQEGRPITVLHLLCHGGAAGSTTGLVFDGAEAGDAPEVVDPGKLRQLLSPFAQTLQLVVLSACASGHAGTLGNQLGSAAQTLHRAGIAAVVASRFPLSVAGSLQLVRTLYDALLVQTTSLQRALLTARQHLAQQGLGLDWASLQLYAALPAAKREPDLRPLTFRPFRGLLAFQPEHARYFFGREPELEQSEQKLRALLSSGQPACLLVAGASGTGKSSLVLAGLVPRLVSATGKTLQQTAYAATDKHLFQQHLYLRPGPEALRQLQRLHAPDSQIPPTLLVMDQFEEVFTQLESPALRQQLVQSLWLLAKKSHLGHAVLLTIRIDHVGRCGELVLDDSGLRLDAVGFAEPHRVFVAQMSAAALKAVITEPMRLLGLTLEEGLLTRMLGEVAGEPGALPLLEDTLDLLWQLRSGSVLTQAAYDEVGGVGGALQRRADSVFAALPAAEKAIARALLPRLVKLAEDPAQSTRQRVRLSELRPHKPSEQAAFESVLHKLTAARLLVCDGDGALRAVEVAHEALIRKWPQLQAWVQADKQLLWELARVEEWLQAWRDYGTVLQGAQLTFAQQVAKKANASLSPAAQYMVRLFTLRAQRYRYVAVATLVLAILALLFDAVLPSALPQRARVVQDVLIAGCLLGLLNFTTAHVSLRRWRPR